MRKPTFFICENKDADQLRSNCEVDQRPCFCYTDSIIIPLLSKSKQLGFCYTNSIIIPLLSKSKQLGLCRTCSEIPHCWFCHIAARMCVVFANDALLASSNAYQQPKDKSKKCWHLKHKLKDVKLKRDWRFPIRLTEFFLSDSVKWASVFDIAYPFHLRMCVLLMESKVLSIFVQKKQIYVHFDNKDMEK